MSPEAVPALSIVIPAYNEEARLPASLERVVEFAGSFPGGVETVLVDDGSRDRTPAIACDFAATHTSTSVLVNPENRGKGYSIRRGFLAAKGDLVLLTDADLSTPLSETPKLIERLQSQGGGIVIGSRGLDSSNVEVHQNAIRESMGRVFNALVRALTNLPFMDTQCGFKLFSRSLTRIIFERARIDGFSYDVEVLYLAMKLGIPVAEVPVTWRNAAGSKVGIVSAPLLMLRDVVRIVRWHRQGLYDTDR